MTKKQAPVEMMSWVKDHLWPIGAVALMLYTSYLTAMNDMQRETAKLETAQRLLDERIEDLEGGFNEMHPRQP